MGLIYITSHKNLALMQIVSEKWKFKLWKKNLGTDYDFKNSIQSGTEKNMILAKVLACWIDHKNIPSTLESI